jgi:hypothetical protein
MLTLHTLIVIGVVFPAGEDAGRLTFLKAISRLRKGIPVHARTDRRDWFSGTPGQCPERGPGLEWVVDIQNGEARFGKGKSTTSRGPHANTTEEKS